MQKKIILGLALAAIAGTIYYFETMKPDRSRNIANSEIETSVSKNYPRARELVSPEGFINTDNITLAELVGKKVILVDFWTYSCINCQRTQPYLNAWYDKYRAAGLEIIGVHTPEFEFEKNYENVKRAVEKAGIKYPVVQDNDYATWQAYGNRYWPRKYLIDIDGYIVYDHIGEGAYEETERKIQELLKAPGDVSRPEAITATQGMPLTPEIYLGSLRNANFLEKLVYLEGNWKITAEYAENLEANSKIRLRYQAKKVYMVASADREVTVKILRDGVFYKALTIQADELYILIDESAYGEHTLEIIPQTPGLRAFAFTFG